MTSRVVLSGTWRARLRALSHRRTGVFGALLVLAACAPPPRSDPPRRDPDLEARVLGVREALFAAENDQQEEAVRAEMQDIFSRHGVPTTSAVGDDAAYAFVLVGMLGMPSDFQDRVLPAIRAAAAHQELPPDVLPFAEARARQKAAEATYLSRAPDNPALRDEIERLVTIDQAVRQKAGFDSGKMEATDRSLATPLEHIFERHGVPTYAMVGPQAAKNFVVMVQHQSPAFRARVLAGLEANVDSGQADPGMYAMVYDRAQRDQGKNQLYGEQLECQAGEQLHQAPTDDPAGLNMRRAKLGLLRVELYTRLVRALSPPVCSPAK